MPWLPTFVKAPTCTPAFKKFAAKVNKYQKEHPTSLSDNLVFDADKSQAALKIDEVESQDKIRERIFSGTKWEELAGFCRAIRIGNRILISGTTATHGDKRVGGNDPAAQLDFIIDKIEGALQSLGARLQDVVRTRIFVSDASHWEAVARAHGERFREILPANTLVGARLIGDEYLVEMEADAKLRDP